MVYATLQQSITALIKAESALQSTLDDIQDRIDQGYAKEMVGTELRKVHTAFNTIDSILIQLEKTKKRFEGVRGDLQKVASSNPD